VFMFTTLNLILSFRATCKCTYFSVYAFIVSIKTITLNDVVYSSCYAFATVDTKRSTIAKLYPSFVKAWFHVKIKLF